MTTDYGNFPITKCPPRAAQGLSNKNAPSIKRIMREINGDETRRRNAERRVENAKIRSIANLDGWISQDKLTGQSYNGGIESRDGCFQNQELRVFKKILGKDVCFVQTATMEDSPHQPLVKDVWDVLQKRGTKTTVEGYEEYEYRHLDLKDFNVIGARSIEDDNIILTWSL